MNKRTLGTLARFVAAAFLAAALAPRLAAAQETPQADKPGQAQAGLGLTSEQQKALDELRKARRDENQAFRDEMAKIRGEMRELAKTPEANRAKIEALIDKRAGFMAERAKSALRRRAEWTKIFTPEQLEKMKALRSRFPGRAGLAARGLRGPLRTGLRAPGRFLRPDFRSQRIARRWALRHRLGLHRRRW